MRARSARPAAGRLSARSLIKLARRADVLGLEGRLPTSVKQRMASGIDRALAAPVDWDRTRAYAGSGIGRVRVHLRPRAGRRARRRLPAGDRGSGSRARPRHRRAGAGRGAAPRGRLPGLRAGAAAGRPAGFRPAPLSGRRPAGHPAADRAPAGVRGRRPAPPKRRHPGCRSGCRSLGGWRAPRSWTCARPSCTRWGWRCPTTWTAGCWKSSSRTAAPSQTSAAAEPSAPAQADYSADEEAAIRASLEGIGYM